MRARLGPASRAATQLGATFTSRDAGTAPLTAPARGVGRLFGLIGLTSSALATPATTRTSTTLTKRADERRERMRTARIQAGFCKRVTYRRTRPQNTLVK